MKLKRLMIRIAPQPRASPLMGYSYLLQKNQEHGEYGLVRIGKQAVRPIVRKTAMDHRGLIPIEQRKELA